MKQLWNRLAFRIDGLGLRQRGLMFAALAFTLIFGTFFAILNPQLAKQKALQTKIETDRKVLAALQAAVKEKAASLAQDPDREEKDRIEAMKKQSTAIRSSIVELQSDLVPAHKMASVLENMLRRNDKLQLRSVKSLPVVMINQQIQTTAAPLGAKAEASKELPRTKPGTPPARPAVAQTPPLGAIYRHGVEIQVEGTYFNFLEYLSTLEGLPWRIYWGKAKLNVDDYPRATLTLTLYTLSLDNKWLGI